MKTLFPYKSIRDKQHDISGVVNPHDWLYKADPRTGIFYPFTPLLSVMGLNNEKLIKIRGQGISEGASISKTRVCQWAEVSANDWRIIFDREYFPNINASHIVVRIKVGEKSFALSESEFINSITPQE